MFNLVSSRDVLNIFSIFLLCFPASITAVRDGLIAGRVQPNDVALRFQACPWVLLFKSIPRFLRFFMKSALSVIKFHFSVSSSFLHKIFLPTLNFTWAGGVWISWILERRSKSRALSLSKSFPSSDFALSKRKDVLLNSSFSPAFLVIRYLAVFLDKTCSGNSR